MRDADEHAREVLEPYGGLHPVTFRHRGYPGLCARGTAVFLNGLRIPGASSGYLDRVEFLLDGYARAADAHERMGDLAGARERKRLIAELRQLEPRCCWPRPSAKPVGHHAGTGSDIAGRTGPI